MPKLAVTVVGAGILGLWQALTLAKRGHSVTLREAVEADQSGSASRVAGAMLAPYCEAEAAEPVVQDLGLRGLEIWRRTYPGVVARGSLVVASRRDAGELVRFARMTEGYREVDAGAVEALEPALSGRFGRGLYFPSEAHLAPRPTLDFLRSGLQACGGEVSFAAPVSEPIWTAAAAGGVVVDCRGLAARGDLSKLRGVRGEMAVVQTADLEISRPIRLLHPRFPLYVVPWGEGRYMIGATVIESEATGPATLRSALDLLTTACAIHPSFADARVLELSVGVRPAFPDNVPRIVTQGRRIIVNGAYRHGYLLAPVLAEVVANYLENDTPIPSPLAQAA